MHWGELFKIIELKSNDIINSCRAEQVGEVRLYTAIEWLTLKHSVAVVALNVRCYLLSLKIRNLVQITHTNILIFFEVDINLQSRALKITANQLLLMRTIRTTVPILRRVSNEIKFRRNDIYRILEYIFKILCNSLSSQLYVFRDTWRN